jgi:hypothetical protein
MRLALRGVLLALVPVAGFSDSDGPSDEIPELGRYRYTYEGLNPALDPIHFEGALILDFASEDSIAGTWDEASPPLA